VRATRAARGAQRRRRRTGAAIVAALVVVAAGYAVLRPNDTDPERGGASTTNTGPDVASSMMAFQLQGAAAPMLAIVGGATDQRPAAVMPVPQDLTMIAPGQGETTATEVAAFDGPSVRITLSNLAGVWLESYVVMNLNGLADTVDAAGGLMVTLTEAYPTKTGVLGPGEITLTGPQARAFLAGTTDDAATRWEIVLVSLLSDPPALEPSEILDTDHAEVASATFEAARGAQVVEVPTTEVAGTVHVAQYEELDAIMEESFGVGPPTSAIVQNGNGAPGVGEAVGALIIPAGFRITLSQNAQTFDIETTDIFANGPANQGAAKRAHKALGVGRWRVTQVPSGIGDITIVVGKDFTLDGDEAG
jgi:hypothetical protein